MTQDEIIDAIADGGIDPAAAVAAYEARVGTTGLRPFKPKTFEQRRSLYERDKALREAAMRNRVPFISPNFSQDFFLYQGLVLVGGVSGAGKSTTVANILTGYLEHSDKSAFVISNEDSSETVYNRTACVMLRKNFNKFFNGHLSTYDQQLVYNKAMELVNRVEVVDDPAWDMTCVEDVKSVLEYAATSDAGIIVIDYFQTVCSSRIDPDMDAVRVSKNFGFYLKEYGKRVGKPVIVFAQLRAKDGDHKEFKTRVENDRTIINHAFQAIEIQPDYAASRTTFIVQKNRFGLKQREEVTMKFDGGRYTNEETDDI